MATEGYDVIVIGAGASGMMAAGRAGERGKRVLLLEHNKRIGAKLGITGGGRCNVTNAESDVHKFLNNYGKSKKALYSAFAQFGVEDSFKFFTKRGLPLVTEARKRVFPESQKATDVVKCLERYCRDNGVTIRTEMRVTGLLIEKDEVVGVKVGKEKFMAKYVVLSTGGISHKETGSTGDGFSFLESIGHTVISPTPTIVPLAVADSWIKTLSGVSLSFMKITFYLNKTKQFSKTGKILFTHFGLSGPLILNSASKVADLLQAGRVTATIDMYPDTDLGSLEKRIIAAFDENKNKALGNVLKDIVPNGCRDAIPFVLPKLDMETRVHSVTKEERKALVQILKAMPVHVTGLMGFDRAVVADGGVVLEEIDMRTMQSKKYKNLLVTGDLLHINRPSGGFSLQLCWTTGYIAGNNV